MPTVGENKHRNNRNIFIDDTRNYKRKSIDEQDDYSIVEDFLYLNKEKTDSQNVQKENLYVNVNLGSTRTSAIGLNIEKSSNLGEKKIEESNSIKNYKNCGDQNELCLESPLNEIVRVLLTCLIHVSIL
ncbi:hypothetical protein PMLGA01_120060700 [Plasmodium malariae]|uniref:Uncharacterized protein n=1 Tax=Plasmodium malariae TaxID=5858 RepID=A0A1C3L1M9_PLAMA|nr:hypothetical protein PMLGA01_120060700 [Plasmodium malariae]